MILVIGRAMAVIALGVEYLASTPKEVAGTLILGSSFNELDLRDLSVLLFRFSLSFGRQRHLRRRSQRGVAATTMGRAVVE
jgi:hypothetical protein